MRADADADAENNWLDRSALTQKRRLRAGVSRRTERVGHSKPIAAMMT